MWRATLRGLVARKLRLGLTALAVVIGVAFVSATYVLTDTLKHSFDSVFVQSASGIDVVVRVQAPPGTDPARRVRVSGNLLTQVRSVPGVGAAVGLVEGYAQFVAPNGRSAVSSGPATLGLSWDAAEPVGPLRLVSGSPPRRDGEVAMDAGTARREGFRIGQTVRVLLTGPAERFRLVGTFSLGGQTDLGGITIAAFDPATAQRVFDAPGAYDLINVVAAPGVPVARVRENLRGALPPAYAVDDARGVALQNAEPVRRGLGFLNDALLGFAAVGLFVGAFIIFNTFTILVSQRTRELGLLRALGAGRAQVLSSVLAEAAVMGAVASAIGLAIGVTIGRFLPSIVHGAGVPIPRGETVVLARTIIAALVVGIGVTVAAAVYPAVRSARISPVEAIASFEPRHQLPLGRRAVIGSLVAAGAVALVVYGLVGDFARFTGRIEVVGVGALLLFVGVALLLPVAARPLSRLLGAPLVSGLGVCGLLARGNAMRNPRRTSATASALVIGLALVCLVATFAASAKRSLADALHTSVRADLILSARQFAGFSTVLADRVRAEPAVSAAVGLRFDDADVAGSQQGVTGVTVAGLERVIDLGLVQGSAAPLARGAVLLDTAEAGNLGLGVGDLLPVAFPRGGLRTLPVAGVYRPSTLVNGPIVSSTTFTQAFGTEEQDSLVLVKARPGERAAATRQVRQVLADFPNVTAYTPAGFQAQQERQIDQFLRVMVALLLLSELIAVLGIVNTLALSVFERTRELGMMRAVGMTRRQVRTMVRGESVIIAVIGGALGIAVGVFWAWVMTRALRGQGLTSFAVPGAQLAVFLVSSAVAGVIAAVVPAWRASRLDVLTAIAATE